MRRGMQVLAALMMLGALACDDDEPTSPTTTFTAQLSAANEVNGDGSPRNTNSTATGTAVFTVRGNLVDFAVTANGLTGPATLSHIHVGSATQNGAIVWGFTIQGVASGTITNGTIDLNALPASFSISADSMLALWNSGTSYVNVHTSANPGGEMRGQIVRQ